MGKAIEKFTLSAARNIPLDKLVLNQQTVRKLRASLSIEDLAQDIAIADCSPASTSGLNSTAMATRPASTAFPPGGALKRFQTLVAQKRLTRTASSPCIVRRGDTQEVEDPLAEGLQHVSLHPLDQFAFQPRAGPRPGGVRRPCLHRQERGETVSESPDRPADLQDEPQASSDDPGDTGREFESESHGRPVGSPASQKPDPIAVRSGLLSDGFPA